MVVNVYKKQSMVAWFRLAESIQKGEKERALTLYRLFSYSLVDKAFIVQLEGDILAAFGDDRAFDRYVDATLYYKSSDRQMLALCTGERAVLFGYEQFLYTKALQFLSGEIFDSYERAHVSRRVLMHEPLTDGLCGTQVFAEVRYDFLQQLLLFALVDTDKSFEQSVFVAWLNEHDQLISLRVGAHAKHFSPPAKECCRVL